ncbi:hypothetical protein RHS02_05979, partial [Rhizoctonia solani]
MVFTIINLHDPVNRLTPQALMLATLRHIESQEEDEKEYAQQYRAEPEDERSEPEDQFDFDEFPELKRPPRELPEVPKRTHGPPCKAYEFLESLRAGEDVDILTWQAGHLALAKEDPYQHKECPRLLWKMVDIVESEETPSELGTVAATLLMYDVYQISQSDSYIHRRARCKLATLLDPKEAVSIYRDMLDDPKDELDSRDLCAFEDVLAQLPPELDILKERVALLRQDLVMNPKYSEKIARLTFALLELYERTSDTLVFDEIHALYQEMIGRQKLDSCPIMWQLTVHGGANWTPEEITSLMTEHTVLTSTSPTPRLDHVHCPGQLLYVVQCMRNDPRGKLELQAALVCEALRLIDLGIGISDQLRVLNTLYETIDNIDPSSELNGFTRTTVLSRLHSIFSGCEHRIPAFSWLATRIHPESLESKYGPEHADVSFEVMGSFLAEKEPIYKWVNQLTMRLNDNIKPNTFMPDFSDELERNIPSKLPSDFFEMPRSFFERFERARAVSSFCVSSLSQVTPDTVDYNIDLYRQILQNWGCPSRSDQPGRLGAGHPIRITQLVLGIALHRRYEYFDNLSDLDEAIQVLRLGMAGSSQEADGVYFMKMRGAAHMSRYRRLGEHTDLMRSYESTKLVFERHEMFSTPGDEREWAKISSLFMGAQTADCLFDATGETRYLDQTAIMLREALRFVGLKNPLATAMSSLLGSALCKRFMYSQVPEDLGIAETLTGGASRVGQSSYVRTGIGLQLYVGSLPNCDQLYGRTMLIKFKHSSQIEDLEQSILMFKKVLDNTSAQSIHYADANYWYGHALSIRSQGDDLATGTHHLRQALLAQPSTSHPQSPVWMTGLSKALVIEFQKTGDRTLLEEAAKLSQTAVSVASKTSTILADVYAQLGEVKYQTFRVTNNSEDLDQCMLAFESAVNSKGSPQLQCLSYTQRWQSIGAEYDHPSLSRVWETILMYQEKAVGVGKSIKRRHEYLANNPSLACRAAAYAIRQGKLELAVEYLERGRSILWRQTLELRSPLDELRKLAPSLADQLAEVIEQLDQNEQLQSRSGNLAAHVTPWTISNPDQIAQSHRMLSQYYDYLLEQIRKIDGFSNFMRSFVYADTVGIASEGPVVILNLCEDGCDALVFLRSGVHHVALPDADFQILSAKRAELVVAAARVVEDQGVTMDAMLRPLLRLLWSSLIEPVVSFIKSSGTTEKRVFWCVAGLSDLPIHAAGPYKPGQRDLPETFISSYIPTLSALIRARKARVVFDSPQPRLLTVIQTETGEMDELISAEEEVETLRELDIITTELRDNDIDLQNNLGMIEEARRLHENERAYDPVYMGIQNSRQIYRDVLLSQIKAHNWVHFCCHGTTDPKLPLLSAFHFSKFKLTIEPLMRAELPLADFAFLSACHTAEGSEAQNENMSLAGALQVAGFRSVVATMYAVADSDGPTVARVLYEHMFRDRSQPANSSDAALGLNKAVRKLRLSKVPMHRWATTSLCTRLLYFTDPALSLALRSTNSASPSTMTKSQKAPKFLTTPPPSHGPHLVISYPAKNVLQLTLNRPRSLNAMTDDLRADIARVMDWFERESSLWVVIITGNGRAFCAGQDLKNWKKKQDTGSRREAEEMAEDTNGFGSLARRRCIKPIIAAVNGIAMGGGVEIILNSDLVVASRDAKLGLPEVKRGVVAAAGGIPRIQRIAGHQFAAELLLTGRTITAEEAHTKYRFVTSVVPQSQVLNTAINLAKEIISNSPDAVWSTKKALLDGQQYASLEEAVIKHNLSEESKRVYQGDNIREGLAAFGEKRKPVWTNPKL